MKIAENITWKLLGEKVVAVNTENGFYFTMNETASTMWIAITEGKSQEDLKQAILEKFDVEQESVLDNEIEEQIREWKELGLIN